MNKLLKYFSEFIIFDGLYYLSFMLFNEMIPSLITAGLGWGLYRFVILNAWLKMIDHIHLIHDLNQLMNSLVLQLSVTPSLYTALEVILPNLTDRLRSQIHLTENESPLINLEKLQYHFNHPTYLVFFQILKIYTEQGGDILHMMQQMLSQINHIKTYSFDYLKAKNKKLRDLVVSWLFSWITIIYMRLLLAKYYMDLIKGDFLFIGVIASFLLFYWSLFLFFKKYQHMNLERGWDL